MKNKLFVCRLAHDATVADIQDLFSAVGTVDNVKMPTDKQTGDRKGFCFVEMSNKAEAEEALKKLNGHELLGRKMVVEFAKEPRRRKYGG